MSSLEYRAKSASPNDELFNYEQAPGGSQFEKARSRDSLNGNSPHIDLRIEVPRSSVTSDTLGDAFQYQGSDGSNNASLEFSSITQLPTPVMPSGASFQGSTSPRTSMQPQQQIQQIGVRKRQTAHVGADRGSRIVSAFDPETHTNLRMDLSPTLAKVSSQTRHISNPGEFTSPSTIVETPSSPPPETRDAEFKGRILLAPSLAKSFVCEQVVGQGSFSTVVAARDTADDSTLVAVKVVSYPADDHTTASSFRSYIVRELGILAHLHHPCIIKLLDYNVQPPVTRAEIEAVYESGDAPANGQENETHSAGFAARQQYFFLEFCSGGNLFDWISHTYQQRSHTRAFWRLMARVVAEIVVAVAHMHRHRIIHRDIKLENVLLTTTCDLAEGDANDPRLMSQPLATLTDFGLSKRLLSDDQPLTTKCGSQDYVSPELLMGLQYNGKLLDSWAVGVLVYSIIENRLPFDLPPPELVHASGISPSVLKRRRSRPSPAHRIAMIDWAWYRALGLQQDGVLDVESKKIVSNLQHLVETFLVRKERRITIQEALASSEFAWVKACVPSHFYC